MEFSRYAHWHLIGIKGAGMAALAEFLIGSKKKVTGSDTAEVFYTDAILERLGIAVATPFNPENLPSGADIFVHSTAYTSENNLELVAARKTGKPVWSYPEVLGILTREKLTIAVCGTHGKTTTSALLADILRHAGKDPSAIIGSEIQSWGGSALSGEGPLLVIEADEYQNKLALYAPLGVILTSVDWDHPDFFPTVADYEHVFSEFLTRIPRHGFAVVCGDHARAEFLSRGIAARRYTYGLLEGNDIRATDIRILPESERQGGILQEFTVVCGERTFGRFRTRLAGRHNIQNILGTIAVTLHLKIDIDQAQEAIEKFSGTKRRFEYLGESGGALIYDDYAHHPDEIRATLSAFRALYPKRQLRVIFHPHTFTRTKALLEAFVESFETADEVIVLDIYGSAREVQGGVSATDLVERINRVTPGKALYASDRSALVADIARRAGENDVIITLGAGDVWQLAQALLRLNKNNRVYEK